MRIITISREFGSGGRELGKRIADELSFDYYDKEIIAVIAQKKGMDERYVEQALEDQIWKRVPLTFRRSFTNAIALQSTSTTFLLEQKKVIEQIGQIGRDCVIVGRNADVILAEKQPFSLFICADMEAKICRCMERASSEEKISRKTIEKNSYRIDKNRAKTREIITNHKWGERGSYDLTVNTTGWKIKELAPVVAEFAMSWFRREK